VHRVLARAVRRIVLGDRPLAEVTLRAADGQRARVHDARDTGEARRLEAVVHPEDVEAEHLVGIALAGADAIREVDEPVRLDVEDDPHDVLELRDVATDDRDPAGRLGERRRAGIEVHADDALAARHQASDEPRTDESRAADDEDRHPGPPWSMTATRAAAARGRGRRGAPCATPVERASGRQSTPAPARCQSTCAG
jgi:hypothetical protein